MTSHRRAGTARGYVPVCFQHYIATHLFFTFSAAQKPYCHVPRQGLSFHGTAHCRHVNIAAMFRFCVKNHIVCGGIRLPVGVQCPAAQGRNMDILNVIPGYQLRMARCQARSDLLADAASCLDRQVSPGGIVFHIPCQIYAAAVRARADQRNAAVFLTQESNADIPVRFEGECIRLGGAGTPVPRHMVIGTGPKPPNFIVFFPLPEITALVIGHFVFIQAAKVRTGYLAVAVIGKFPDKSALFQFKVAVASDSPLRGRGFQLSKLP